MSPDFFLGLVLGAVLMYYVPRAWKEAGEADRIEAMTQDGPLRPRRRP
jgi:hypothetical protein